MVNNRVFQILPVKNNTILPKGEAIDAIGVGQLGVFDADTNLSIDATTTTLPGKFYLAVGVDTNGDTTVDDVIKTMPYALNAKDAVFYDTQCATDGVNKVIDINLGDCDVQCDSPYSIGVELYNDEFYRLNGFNQTINTYSVKSICCEGCCTDEDDNTACVDLAKKFFDAINNDAQSNFLVTAQYVDLNPTVPVIVTDPDAWAADAANAGLCLSLRITIGSLPFYKYCCINSEYFKIRQTDAIVSLRTGFDCCGSTSVVTDLEYPQGLGYDLQQLQYTAGGFDGQPGIYRVGDLKGLPFNPTRHSFDNNTEKFFQINVSVDNESSTAWTKAPHAIEFIVAIPQVTAAEPGVVDPLLQLFDSLFPQLTAKASSTTGCSFS